MNPEQRSFQRIHGIDADGMPLLLQEPIDLNRSNAFHVRECSDTDVGQPPPGSGSEVQLPGDGGIECDLVVLGWSFHPSGFFDVATLSRKEWLESRQACGDWLVESAGRWISRSNRNESQPMTT